MAITIEGFHHASFMITSVARSAEFYGDVLGLQTLPRPDLGFPGLWYDLNNGQQLHLMETDKMPGGTGQYGFDTHIALNVPDMEAARRELEAHGIEHAFGNGRAGNPQIFLRDPDGNMLELR